MSHEVGKNDYVQIRLHHLQSALLIREERYYWKRTKKVKANWLGPFQHDQTTEITASPDEIMLLKGLTIFNVRQELGEAYQEEIDKIIKETTEKQTHEAAANAVAEAEGVLWSTTNAATQTKAKCYIPMANQNLLL